MQQLSTIEQIAFDGGQILKIDQLPPHIKAEVDLFNTWTVDLVQLQQELENINSQVTLTQYARQAAYTNVQQLAQAMETLNNEAFTPTDGEPEVGVDSPDSATESHSNS